MPTLLLRLHSRGQPIVLTGMEVHYCNRSDDDDDWKVRAASGNLQNTNRLFNECQNLKVGGRPLPEYFSFRGVGYWEFLPSYLWPDFFVATQLIETLSEIFESARPASVLVFPSEESLNSIWLSVARAVAQRYHARFEVKKRRSSEFSVPQITAAVKRTLRRKGAGHLIRHLRRTGAAWAFATRRPVGDAAAGRRKALFLTLARRHWVDRPGTSGREQHDEQFYPLLSAFASRGWSEITLIDVEDLSQSELRQRNCATVPRLSWQRFSSHASCNPLGSLPAVWHFHRLWRRLRNDEAFNASFAYRGIALMPVLTQVLEHAMRDIAPECCDFLTIAAKTLDREAASVIVMTYETGPWERAFIVEAFRRRIPTVGLQHGMIFSNHYDYMHWNKTNDPYATPGVFSVPRVTCVWGDAWKETLMTCGYYPEGSVEVTGHWRYDFLGSKISEEPRRKAGSAVIAVCLAGDNIAEAFRSCLQAVRAIGDVSIRVRLHPSDDEQPIRALLAEYGLSEQLIHRGNLFDLLCSCDAVMSQYSTLISEAALADKPIVLLDLDKKFFTSAYTDAGICVHVTERDELKGTVERILTDTHLQARLEAGRRTFISRYFLHLDGGAAERVVDVVERLCLPSIPL